MNTTTTTTTMNETTTKESNMNETFIKFLPEILSEETDKRIKYIFQYLLENGKKAGYNDLQIGKLLNYISKIRNLAKDGYIPTHLQERTLSIKSNFFLILDQIEKNIIKAKKD